MHAGNMPVPAIPLFQEEESWGTMELFDDFVEKALARILTDKIAMDREDADVCTTRCA